MKLLTILLLLLLPIVGQAQFTYTANADNTLTITGYDGTNDIVMLPSTIVNLPVTAIGDNAWNGGTFGQQIPGVGNPATAPVKAGANALAKTAMMVGPMGEERAAATTLKEAKEVVTIVERERYEIIDEVRRRKAADLVGHDTITAQILNSEGKVVGTREIPVNQLLSPKSSIDASTPGNMDRFMSTLNKTKAGFTPPPILVQPGSRGVPIKDVTLDPIGGH